MKQPRKESISNVIHEGIKRGIQILIDNKCCGSALVLLYAGMDTMAFLNMPAGQQEVTRADFVEWVERSIFASRARNSFQASICTEQGVASCTPIPLVLRSVARGNAERSAIWISPGRRYAMTRPLIRILVMVSIVGLAEAFYRGLDRFIIDVFGNPLRAPLARERLRKLLHALPTGNQPSRAAK